MIEYIVQKQEYSDLEGVPHQGKVIVAQSEGREVGSTGYVEWNTEQYASNERNTARMKTVDSVFELHVNPNHREKGIGRGVVEKLFEDLDHEGYDQLVIVGATQRAKGFYDKVFEEMVQSGAISSFKSVVRSPPESSTTSAFNYIYDVRL